MSPHHFVIWAAVLGVLGILGCSKKTDNASKEPSYSRVNNDATRYVESLHRDLDKAQAAANQMNQKIAFQEEQYQKFQNVENQDNK